MPWMAPRPGTLQAADRLLESCGVDDGGLDSLGFAPGRRIRPGQAVAAGARRRGHRRPGTARGRPGAWSARAADRATARAIESLAAAWQPRVVDLIGRTSVRMLVGVVARCSAFVSNDSGAMHIAAALGVPLTAIFGPTDERVTRPLGRGRADVLSRDVFCRPCLLRECPIDHRCMNGIDVDAARRAAHRSTARDRCV